MTSFKDNGVTAPMNYVSNNCLIAYYSRKGENYVKEDIVNLSRGNTEIAAKMIQTITGGDLFRIETATPYPKDYTETTRVAQKEKSSNARPGLVGKVSGMDTYDVIFPGYPNWWRTMPMAVFTFLESYDFSKKTILPFCTHEGSGMGHSEKDIAKTLPDATV